MIHLDDIRRLNGIYPEPKPKKPPQKTLKQRMARAYYQRNRERMKAASLASYYARKHDAPQP